MLRTVTQGKRLSSVLSSSIEYAPSCTILLLVILRQANEINLLYCYSAPIQQYTALSILLYSPSRLQDSQRLYTSYIIHILQYNTCNINVWWTILKNRYFSFPTKRVWCSLQHMIIIFCTSYSIGYPTKRNLILLCTKQNYWALEYNRI